MTHRRTTFGRPALDALRAAVAEAKSGDPMAPVTVIVPTNIAGIAARRHLAGGLTDGSNGVAGIWFTTLPRLAERIAAPVLHAQGRRPLTEPVIATAIRRRLDREPGIFAAVAEHPATAQAIARAHRALRDVDEPAALEAIAATSTLSTDLVRLHRQISGDLATEYYDPIDLLTTAADLGAADLGTVVAYLLPVLGNHEQAFLDALAAAVPLTTIEAGHSIDEAPCAQRVMTASDSDDEVRCVVREVVQILADTPAHRVGVFYSARSPYARLLHEHLDQAGIVTNGAGVLPVIERALPRLLLGLLETARTDWGRGDLLRTLSELAVRDDDGERIPTSRWERISREAGVVSGDDWVTRLEALAEQQRQDAADWRAEEPDRADRLERDAAETDRFRGFVAALRQEIHDASGSASWSAASAALRALLDRLLPVAARERMPLEEQYAAGHTERALAALIALDDGPQKPSTAGIQDALLLTLEAGLPRVGRFGTGVFTAPIGEAVGVDLDTVFIVGLSEDLYPGRVRDDSLLPERVREASLGRLPSLRDDIERNERELLAAVQSAPRVTLSFPRGDLRRHTNRLPSRWVLPTLRHHAGDLGLPATKFEEVTGEWLADSPSYAGSIATATPATEQEWRQRALLAQQDLDDPALSTSRTIATARRGDVFSPYDGNLGDSAGLPAYRTGERVLAATSLETYAVCPHTYFVQRMLHVRPLDEPEASVEASPIDVGNLVHEVFDLWVREAVEDGSAPGYGVPWSDRQVHRLRDIAEERAAAYERAGRTGHPTLWARRKKIILGTLDWMAADDSRWRAERDARVVGSELRFGYRDCDPVTVEVPGGAIAFRGSIDKVDETRDGTILVTDIKTGSPRTFLGLGEDNPVGQGEKLQLPLYAQAARQLLDRPDARVEAGYWFVLRERGRRISVPLTDAVVGVYRHTLGVLVAGMEAGVFPQRAPDGPDFRWVQCPYCNPDGLGHADARDRWRQLRLLPELVQLTSLVEPDALATEDPA